MAGTWIDVTSAEGDVFKAYLAVGAGGRRAGVGVGVGGRIMPSIMRRGSW